jgi:uncharacterized protein (TIGR00299 family) protein
MIGFLDCYSGISGDMLLGALVDAGVPVAHLSGILAGLSLADDVQLEAEEVQRGGLRATKVHVQVRRDQPHRTLREIKAMLDGAALDVPVRERSLEVLGRLAAVEGRVHGLPPDQVELHELGAIDSIADVVGSVAGLAYLGVERLYASTLPASPGSIEGGQHGALPSPAPATLALVAAAGAPIRPFGDGRELVTPTGAAIVATLARFEQPTMTVQRVGYGAGSAELPWPNVLRLWLGEDVSAQAGPVAEEHVVLETNIDDMSPQLLAPIVDALFAAGALDVTVTPVVMKKGRSGSLVGVIARAQDERRLALLLLRETTTLGVRVHPVRRHEAERRFETVSTRYGPVTVKVKLLDGRVTAAMPEFDSVRQLATSSGAPLLRVHAAAASAAEALVGGERATSWPAEPHIARRG